MKYLWRRTYETSRVAAHADFNFLTRGAARGALKPATKPPFKYRPQFGLIIVCRNEAEQRRRYEALRKRGLKVRVVAV